MMTWLTHPEKAVERLAFSPHISFFKRPVSNIVPFKDITLIEVYSYLKSDYAKEQTERLRAITDKSLASRFKAENFDYVTFGGTFTTRRYVRDDDYIPAMTISSVLQQHMLRIISELPKKTTPWNPIGQAKEPLLLQTFWDNLPDEFEAKDFKEIAGSIGLTIPTAERYIRAWTGTRLERVMRGKYRKC